QAAAETRWARTHADEPGPRSVPQYPEGRCRLAAVSPLLEQAVLRSGELLGPIREMLLAAPVFRARRRRPRLGVVLGRSPPGLTVGRKQALELVVSRIAGHPRACHTSLLVGTVHQPRKPRARSGDARQLAACYMDRTRGSAHASRPAASRDRAGRGQSDTTLQVTGITPGSGRDHARITPRSRWICASPITSTAPTTAPPEPAPARSRSSRRSSWRRTPSPPTWPRASSAGSRRSNLGAGGAGAA